MAHHRDYVLNMIKALKSGVYTRSEVIEDVFSGAAELNDDKDIQEESKASLVYLVKEGILTASQGETLVRKYFPEMISKKNKQIARSNHTSGPKPTIYSSSEEIYNRSKNSPIIADMARMSQQWIKDFWDATQQEREEILRRHIEAHNARQAENQSE